MIALIDKLQSVVLIISTIILLIQYYQIDSINGQLQYSIGEHKKKLHDKISRLTFWMMTTAFVALIVDYILIKLHG